jgi:hypothetical protein
MNLCIAVGLERGGRTDLHSFWQTTEKTHYAVTTGFRTKYSTYWIKYRVYRRWDVGKMCGNVRKCGKNVGKCEKMWGNVRKCWENVRKISVPVQRSEGRPHHYIRISVPFLVPPANYRVPLILGPSHANYVPSWTLWTQFATDAQTWNS